ncbi:hypothetical protein DPMN_025868 [Dreissena polymorpha]|uniref:Uncharacterized protein n=1 Tax=Dreissena polymorpha TaxID=45954 RepID=A0A9D4LSA7_DREPO|nr:hypothetical protein DPMN_025868 [Dreissena polymorpha]
MRTNRRLQPKYTIRGYEDLNNDPRLDFDKYYDKSSATGSIFIAYLYINKEYFLQLDWLPVEKRCVSECVVEVGTACDRHCVLPRVLDWWAFHDDWAKNVTSRVFTSCLLLYKYKKTAPPPGSQETNVLTKFHENWAKNVTSRRKMPRPLAAMFFSPIWTIFELVRDINKNNVLTYFHDDWAKIVTSRVFTRKLPPPPGSHIIQLTVTIFELNSHIKETNAQNIIGTNLLTNVNKPLVQDIIKTDLLTKFHEDRTVNVASRVHFFQANIIIFKLIHDIITTNFLTKFHEDWTINVASRVLTRFYYSLIKPYMEKCPAPGGHVFKATKTIFKLIQDIIGTNLPMLTRKTVRPRGGHVFQPTAINFELVQDIMFYEDRTINVASREKCPAPWRPCFSSKHIIKTNLPTIFHQDWTINVVSRVLSPAPGGHVFQPTGIIFKHVQDIIGMNLLTEFHEHRTIHVTSRVLTRFYYSHIRKKAPPLGSHVFQAKFHEDRKINVASRVLTRKNAPPPGGHVFQPTGIIFKLVQDISGTNLLSKFHEDRTIYVASRVFTRKNGSPPGGHVFQPTGIIFELVQDIIGMNLLTKFYEEQTINVASKVLTRFYYRNIRKNAQPLGSHVFQANVTIFELIQYIIETNLLTKFHEDWTINVASRELTRQMLTPHYGQRTTDKKRSQKLTMST